MRWLGKRGGVATAVKTRPCSKLTRSSKSALVGRFRAGEMVSGWSIPIRHPCVRLSVPSLTQPCQMLTSCSPVNHSSRPPPAYKSTHKNKQKNPHTYCEHRGLNLDFIPSLKSNIKSTLNQIKLHNNINRLSWRNCSSRNGPGSDI